jgi:hypothetical protein
MGKHVFYGVFDTLCFCLIVAAIELGSLKMRFDFPAQKVAVGLACGVLGGSVGTLLNGRKMRQPRAVFMRFACLLVPKGIRPTYSRRWSKDFGIVFVQDGRIAAFRFAVGLVCAAFGIRYLYSVTAYQFVALTTAERASILLRADRTRRTIRRSAIVFAGLGIGSVMLGYSFKVAVGGLILNLLASWMQSDEA